MLERLCILNKYFSAIQKKPKKILKEINFFVMPWSGLLLVVFKEYNF